MNAQVVRFGYSDSIHILPLLHPLLEGWVYMDGFRLELVAMAPQELNDGLVSGALDGALLDPVIFSRLRSRMEPLPGLGLASEGSTAAAILSSQERADNLDSAHVELAPGAAGTIAETLLRVLQKPFFDIDVRLVKPGEVTTAGEEPVQPRGKLLAGDDGVRGRAPWLLYEAQFTIDDKKADSKKAAPATLAEPDPATAGFAQDLGSAWWVLTGTPMVWSLAAVHSRLLDNEKAIVELVRAFRESRRSATEQLDTVVAAAAKKIGVGEPAIRAIFAATRTDIGAKEQGGLGLFLENTKRLRIT